MADVKITALTAISSNPVNPATFPIPMVDLLDNTITASGTTKKVTVNQILGAGGTATLASATITGALTVDTTTLVVNPSGYADRVGIGTATPATTLDVNGDITQRNGSGTIIGNIQNSSGLYDVKASANVTGLQLSTAAATPIVFAINNAEAMRLNASGNLAFPTGKGIDFAAVTGGTGTATANVLNDYEEGTWVPALKFGGANVGMTPAFTGRYTKVGRAVTVNGILSISNKGSSTGDATITGLPFTSANASAEYTAVSLRFGVVSFLNAFQGYVGSNSSRIEMEQITSAGVVSTLTDTNFSNISVVIVNFTYTV